MYYRESTARRIFNVFNVSLLCVISLIMLYPMFYVLFGSLSNPDRFMAHKGLLFFPLGFNLDAYAATFNNPMIPRGYINTIMIVVVGVFINTIMTSLGAYCLSRKNVMWKNIIMFFIVFSMFFEGGLIPFYFTVKQLNLDNSLWSLIIPVAINTFNLIILRTYFLSVPDSMEESATIDGASHIRILFLIMIPLSLPAIAVIVLYYGVFHWNSWFHAMLFIRKREMFPLQLVLREILISNDTNSMTINVSMEDRHMIGETIKLAVIIVTTLPILALYPFLQKYFIKGVMIGAIKG